MNWQLSSISHPESASATNWICHFFYSIFLLGHLSFIFSSFLAFLCLIYYFTNNLLFLRIRLFFFFYFSFLHPFTSFLSFCPWCRFFPTIPFTSFLFPLPSPPSFFPFSFSSLFPFPFVLLLSFVLFYHPLSIYFFCALLYYDLFFSPHYFMARDVYQKITYKKM